MMVSLGNDRRYIQKIGLIADLNMQIKKCPSFLFTFVNVVCS